MGEIACRYEPSPIIHNPDKSLMWDGLQIESSRWLKVASHMHGLLLAMPDPPIGGKGIGWWQHCGVLHVLVIPSSRVML